MQNLKIFSLIILVLSFVVLGWSFRYKVRFIDNKILLKYNNKVFISDYILKIDKINLEVKGNYENKLSDGLEVHEISKNLDSPMVISGHSGIGNNVYFNELHLLKQGDEIKLIKQQNVYTYKVENIIYFTKGNKLSINKTSDYLYLVTCDLYDMQKQLIISSKLAKIAKI